MDKVKELDKWFSIYVRCRDADDQTGCVNCYTCGSYHYWKHVDCGHFIRRGHWKLRFDKDNARPQCKICNSSLSGNEKVFEAELRAELGDEMVDEMLRMKNDEAGFDERWYDREIASLKSTVKNMPAYNTMVG